MEELEDKLSSLLNDPSLMEKLSEAAKNITGSISSNDAVAAPGFDPALLGALSSLAQQGSIDPRQQALLNALIPYISQDRVQRLQKAMQAARMAKLASSIGGLSLFTGR